MTNEEIAVELESHHHEIKSLEHRMDAAEKKQEIIATLTASVNELAINMKYMVEEQKEQGKRLKKLENEPIESAKYWKRLVIGSVITTVVGIVIGAVMTNIFIS